MSLPAPKQPPSRLRRRTSSPITFAADSLAALTRQGYEYAAITVPAPQRPPERFRALAESTALLWAAPNGPTIAAGGELVRLTAAGLRRMQEVKTQAGELWPKLGWACYPGLKAPGPRLYGGFSHAPGLSGATWRALGNSAFVLPKWSYGRQGVRAWLTMAVRCPTGRTARYEILRELEDLLSYPAGEAPSPVRGDLIRLSEAGEAELQELVEKGRQAVRSGELSALHVASYLELQAEVDWSADAILARLAPRHPQSYCFSIRRGDTALVGASPYRVLARRGNRYEVDVHAGCISNLTRGTQRVLASARAREQVERTVAELCAELDAATKPRMEGRVDTRRTRDYQYLLGTISGGGESVPDAISLLAAAYPPPRQSGRGRESEAAWLMDNEATPRGWFSGPVGWFDEAGDGEFAVADCAALIRGTNAQLFASAEIDAGGRAGHEQDEAALKLRALLAAAGVSPRRR